MSAPSADLTRAPRLSICLFTHQGRREVLAEGLASVFGQIDTTTGDVEVCLTDNASQDGTEELAAELKREHPGQFRYLRHQRDLGEVANLLSCVELACSDYCWILTSDDALEAGGIARVLELIDQAKPPGIVVGKANFDITLTQLTGQGGEDFYPPEQRRTLRYTDADAFLDDCGLHASVVSTLIVHRASWLAALAELRGTRRAELTVFPHLAIMAAMARDDPGWIWCPAKLVRVRMGNAFLAHDQGWSTEQIHMRLLEDMNRMWIRQLGRRSRLRWRLMRRAYRTFVVPKVLQTAAPEGRSLHRRAAMLSVYMRIFWWLPEFWLRTVPPLIAGGSTKGVIRRTSPMPELSVEQRCARLRINGMAQEVPNSQEVPVRLEITNCAPVMLSPDSPRRIVVGYRWHDLAGEVRLQGPAIALPHALMPTDTLTCTVELLTPSEPGRYELRLALAQEDVGWFNDSADEFACGQPVEVRRYGWTDPPVPANASASQPLT